MSDFNRRVRKPPLFSAERLDWERRQGEATGVRVKYHYRFCETCQQQKPKGKRKAVKGWKCDDCRGEHGTA